MTSQNQDASFSFDVKYMRKEKHSVFLFLPEAYHAPIGLIVAYWGNFEVIFDACLEGLIAREVAIGHARETTGWNVWKFAKRVQLFKDICRERLSPKNESVSIELIALIDTASDLHARRNIIAHGTYSYSVLPNSSIVSDCYAFSASKNRKMKFDEIILKKLYHDISHLSADLLLTFQSIARIEGPYNLIPDAEILRVYRETTHAWNPNPKRRPDAV